MAVFRVNKYRIILFIDTFEDAILCGFLDWILHTVGVQNFEPLRDYLIKTIILDFAKPWAVMR